MHFSVKIPGSSANLGCGFDSLGIALEIYLILHVTIPDLSPGINISAKGCGSDTVSLDPDTNLITSTASKIAALFGKQLPSSMKILCENQIPFGLLYLTLGSGLGSSATAIVAGVALANTACLLNLSRDQILDYCLNFEGHPDNVSPSIFGGFVAAFCRNQESHALEVHDEPTCTYIQLTFSDSIKAVVITPNFKLPTVLAREAIPKTHSMSDIVFNLQRVSVLVAALGKPNPESRIIGEAMQDKLHQPYRQGLVPGLQEILLLKNVPGLLGVCLSGAGPTVLALCNSNFQGVGRLIQDIFGKNKNNQGEEITSDVRVLDIDVNGLVIS